jgi:hypothetical protein
VIGDRALDPEIELVFRTADGQLADLVAGGEVPLIQPPQGGKVVLVGVRARNVDGCGLQLTASLRDPCTDRIIGLESRPVNLRAGADGWGEPSQPAELSDYANLAACPSAAAVHDIEGEPYLLRIRVDDGDGREASAEAMIVPVCAEPELVDQCKCECSFDYVLGDPCVPEIDGGPTGCPVDAGL